MNAEATAVRNAERMATRVPGRWSAPPSDVAVRAAAKLMLAPLRLLATPMGRRLAATTVLSVALVGAVNSLYEHADGPAVTVQRALHAVPAAASKPAAAAIGETADASGRPSAATAPRAAKRPEDAAAAWYARQEGVPPSRVHALQRQRVSATVTRVLVMAEVSATDMPTTFVDVKRDGEGWKVP